MVTRVLKGMSVIGGREHVCCASMVMVVMVVVVVLVVVVVVAMKAVPQQ
jgi:hypothetical protein